MLFPKPEPRARQRRRRRRQEVAVIQTVRPQCEARDGYCRLNVPDAATYALVTALFGPCAGWSQWAHLEAKRRSRTRGMKPDARHTTADTAMLCKGHHERYDAHEFDVEFRTARRADGPLRFVRRATGERYEEPGA